MEPQQRVCPDCGLEAGSQPFCAHCGKNLANVDRLPTRAEWEAEPTEAGDPARAEAGKQELRVCVECATPLPVRGACSACGGTLGARVQVAAPRTPERIREALEAKGLSECSAEDKDSPREAAPTSRAKDDRVDPLKSFGLMVGGVVLLLLLTVVTIAVERTGGGGSEPSSEPSSEASSDGGYITIDCYDLLNTTVISELDVDDPETKYAFERCQAPGQENTVVEVKKDDGQEAGYDPCYDDDPAVYLSDEEMREYEATGVVPESANAC